MQSRIIVVYLTAVFIGSTNRDGLMDNRVIKIAVLFGSENRDDFTGSHPLDNRAISYQTSHWFKKPQYSL